MAQSYVLCGESATAQNLEMAFRECPRFVTVCADGIVKGSRVTTIHHCHRYAFSFDSCPWTGSYFAVHKSAVENGRPVYEISLSNNTKIDSDRLATLIRDNTEIHRWPKTAIAILCCCDSSKSDNALAHALIEAGCAAVLIVKWKNDARPSLDLVGEIFRNLGQGVREMKEEKKRCE